MKQRILVAIIGVPALIGVLCFAPDWATAVLVAAFHALGIQVGGVINSKQHCMPAVMSKALTPASVRARHSSTVVSSRCRSRWARPPRRYGG